MRFLFLLSFLSGAALAGECPDYAGQFEWADEYRDNVIELVVEQMGCESMVMTYDQGFGFKVRDKHVFDGNEHLITEYDDFKATERAWIGEAGIRILEERWVGPPEARTSHYFVDIEVLKPSADQLVIKRTLVREDGARDETDKYTYSRIR